MTRRLVLRCRERISHELNEFNEPEFVALRMHHKKNLLLPLLFTSGLAALALIPSVHENPRTIWAFLGAASALLMWNALLAVGIGQHRKPQVEAVLRKQHYVQACAQSVSAPVLGLVLAAGVRVRSIHPRAVVVRLCVRHAALLVAARHLHLRLRSVPGHLQHQSVPLVQAGLVLSAVRHGGARHCRQRS